MKSEVTFEVVGLKDGYVYGVARTLKAAKTLQAMVGGPRRTAIVFREREVA